MATAISGFTEPQPTRASGLDTRSDFKLANGLRVVLEENHATPVVAVQAWIDAGAAEDPENRPGLAYLLKDLVMRSPRIDELAALGGRLSAWVSHDQAVYRAVIAATYAARGLRVMADVISHPDWPPAAFESTRTASVASARQAAWTPQRLATELAFETAFAADGPRAGAYGSAVEGSPAQLALASEPEVRSFHDRFYVAPRTVLVIVGDFDTAAIRADLKAAFGGWPERPKVTVSPLAPPARAPDPLPARAPARLVVRAGDVSQPELAIAFRTPSIQQGDAPAIELLAALIGRTGAGRLDTSVVRTRQVATRAGAYLFEGRHAGMLVASASLTPGHIDEVARAIIDEILRFARERVDAADLERARVVVDGEDAADKSSLDGYAAKLGWFAALAGDASFEKKYRARFHKVDAADVEGVARKYLRASNMVVAVVVPEGPAVNPDGERPSAQRPSAERLAQVVSRMQVVLDTCEQQVTLPPPVRRASAVEQDFVDYRLPSGVRLLVIPDDTAAQLSVRALWRGGGRADDARLSGASALIARLLPRGSRSRGGAPLDAELADIAGTMEGISGEDLLGLRADFLASHWERGLEVMADVLRNPLFAEEDVERERRVQLDLIRRRDDDPSALALQAFREALYGAHPYRQDVLGTLESVSALTRRRLLDHFRRNYRTSGLTIAVVGAVVPSRVAEKVQALFGAASLSASLAPAPVESGLPRISPRDTPFELTRTARTSMAHVVLGYLGLRVGDPDRFALDVIAEILGGEGGASRLPGSPVTAGSSVAAGTAVGAYEAFDPGFFAISATVRPDALDVVVKALRAQIARLVEHGATPQELTRARQLLVGRSALALDRRGAVAMALAIHGAFNEIVASYRADIEELAKVTVEDVSRVARRVLDPKGEVLVVVRPQETDKPPEKPTLGLNRNRIPPEYTLR